MTRFEVRAFRISERDLDARCREVRLEGELDLSVADRLKARLDAAAGDDVEVLVCLEDCEFIDSTGIAVIVLAHRLMAKQGRRLVVCHPAPQVSRILALTGLTKEGIVFDTTDEALAERFGHVVSRPFRAEHDHPVDDGTASPILFAGHPQGNSAKYDGKSTKEE